MLQCALALRVQRRVRNTKASAVSALRGPGDFNRGQVSSQNTRGDRWLLLVRQIRYLASHSSEEF